MTLTLKQEGKNRQYLQETSRSHCISRRRSQRLMALKEPARNIKNVVPERF
jgi:hypothetical protein